MNCKFVKAKDYIISLRNNRPKLLSDKWKERSICLLHGPREADKSTMAKDIAAEVSDRGIEVLYVNVDGHDDSFDQPIDMVERLYVFTPEYESPDDTRDYADLVFDGIEEAAKTTPIRTVVIDSVTRIAALSFGRNASVAYIMKRLAALQMRYKLSLLVIAHDTTRATDRALLNYAESEITVAKPEPHPEADPANGKQSDGNATGFYLRGAFETIDPATMAVAKPQTRSNFLRKCTVAAPRKSKR